MTFLKWAGGKTQLLDQIIPYFKNMDAHYWEPFVGSGAVFFELRRQGLINSATLSDLNRELITTYVVVRDNVDALIERLYDHKNKHCEEHYYETRAQQPFEITDLIDIAARMIYLNKTCYNGLYRRNKKSQFNVPMGAYKNPNICDEKSLREASNLLQNVEIVWSHYLNMFEQISAGDYAYLDPPYLPTKPGYFSQYLMSVDSAWHQELCDAVKELSGMRGVHFVLSNSDHEILFDWYDDFNIKTVQANRRINSKGSKRGPVMETITTNIEVTK